MVAPSTPRISESFLRSLSSPFCRDSQHCFISRNASVFSYCTVWPETEETLKPAYGLSKICTWGCPHYNRKITDVWQHHSPSQLPNECGYHMVVKVTDIFQPLLFS